MIGDVHRVSEDARDEPVVGLDEYSDIRHSCVTKDDFTNSNVTSLPISVISEFFCLATRSKTSSAFISITNIHNLLAKTIGAIT